MRKMKSQFALSHKICVDFLSQLALPLFKTVLAFLPVDLSNSIFVCAGNPLPVPIRPLQPVPRTRWPLPAALKRPTKLPTAQLAKGNTENVIEHRTVVPGQSTPAGSESHSDSLIGLAGINNLDSLEEQQQAKPQGAHLDSGIS